MVHFLNEVRPWIRTKTRENTKFIKRLFQFFYVTFFYNKDMRKNYYFENTKEYHHNVINGSNISITGNSKLTLCI